LGISPCIDALALLAFVLLEAFPFPCPESQRLSSLTLAGNRAQPHAFEADVSANLYSVLGFCLSGTSGKVPSWVLLPVLQSFKEQGNWLYLFRGCRPLEVFVLVSTVAS